MYVCVSARARQGYECTFSYKHNHTRTHTLSLTHTTPQIATRHNFLRIRKHGSQPRNFQRQNALFRRDYQGEFVFVVRYEEEEEGEQEKTEEEKETGRRGGGGIFRSDFRVQVLMG